VKPNHTKKGRFGTRDFNGIPRAVMLNEDYRQLPGNAVKLLMAIVHQYRGRNNGDLNAAYSVMSEWGFNSKQTLSNALQALLKSGLIHKTRQGRFTNPGGVCSLYAITWRPIDECPGKQLEAKPTNTPPRKFSMEQNK
jgi:hypothetical protein